MIEDIERILYREDAIRQRLGELADEITRDYAGREITAIVLLNGSFIFAADLLRRIPLPLHIDAWSISSYRDTGSTGRVRFRQQELADVRGRHVLLLDDILDTGTTLEAVKNHLLAHAGAADIRIGVLLRKDLPVPRRIEADYVGFDIPNEFVVGYGLDYNENYRHLPFIGVLGREAVERGRTRT